MRKENEAKMKVLSLGYCKNHGISRKRNARGGADLGECGQEEDVLSVILKMSGLDDLDLEAG